jgi:hypothetical protein
MPTTRAEYSAAQVKHRRMADNPLAPLTPVNDKTDRRHDRGVLTQAEFDARIRATRAASAFRGPDW